MNADSIRNRWARGFAHVEPIASVMAEQRGALPVAHAERREIADDAHAVICRRVGADPDMIREIACRVLLASLHESERELRQRIDTAMRDWPFTVATPPEDANDSDEPWWLEDVLMERAREREREDD